MPVPNGITGTLYAIWGTAANNIFAVGDAGMIVHDDGIRWSQMSSGSSEYLRAHLGSSARKCVCSWTDGSLGTITAQAGVPGQWLNALSAVRQAILTISLLLD